MKKEKKQKGWLEIDIKELVKADWNYKTDDEAKLKKLQENIKRNGQIENIIIRELDTGFFEIVNGNHRYEALLSLNQNNVMCYNLGKISDSQARRIAIETNETRFETDNIKLAELISEISQDFTLEDLEETMPFNQTELTNFKELLDFDWNKFSPTEDDNLEEENEDLEEKEVNLKFVELKLNITDEVYSIWEQWKKTIKTNLNDMNLSDNKCFEFALAEALSTIREVKDE